MSWLSKYVVDPLKSLVSLKIVVTPKFPVDNTAPSIPAPSTAGMASQVIYDTEALIKSAVDDAILKLLGPIGLAAQPAVDAVLALAEQHINAYVSALFDHAKAQV